MTLFLQYQNLPLYNLHQNQVEKSFQNFSEADKERAATRTANKEYFSFEKLLQKLECYGMYVSDKSKSIRQKLWTGKNRIIEFGYIHTF